MSLLNLNYGKPRNTHSFNQWFSRRQPSMMSSRSSPAITKIPLYRASSVLQEEEQNLRVMKQEWLLLLPETVIFLPASFTLFIKRSKLRALRYWNRIKSFNQVAWNRIWATSSDCSWNPDYVFSAIHHKVTSATVRAKDFFFSPAEIQLTPQGQQVGVL